MIIIFIVFFSSLSILRNGLPLQGDFYGSCGGFVFASAASTTGGGSSPSSSSSAKTVLRAKDGKRYFDWNKLQLWYAAPFFSGSGYGTNAVTTIVGMDELDQEEARPRTRISHFADAVNWEAVRSMRADVRQLLDKLNKVQLVLKDPVVVVCHSEPGAWAPGEYWEPLYKTLPCPPVFPVRPGVEERLYYWDYLVGRTLFETDRLPDGWTDRLNAMDEIWVPGQFHVHSFTAAGVDPDKLVVIPEPVDAAGLFSPVNTEPFPSRWQMILETDFYSDFRYADGETEETPFVFLSVFKWEERKGWDLLIEAFAREFRDEDTARLVILTKEYHDDDGHGQTYRDQMVNVLQSRVVNGGDFDDDDVHAVMRRVRIIDVHLPELQLARFYATADAIVQPSRGEGWGRPHAEAMAMKKPVIATRWGGNLEFMTDENSLLVDVEAMVHPTKGPFTDHLWAQPSLLSLRKQMRRAFDSPGLCARIGQKARTSMLRYTPDRVARLVINQLKKISKKVQQRRADFFNTLQGSELLSLREAHDQRQDLEASSKQEL